MRLTAQHEAAVTAPLVTMATGALIALFSVGMCDRARANDIPLPKAYTAFTASTAALTASASELVQLERATERLNKIKEALSQKLLTANPTDKITLGDTIDERILLCNVRAGHLATVARFNYLNSIVSQIQEVSKQSKPGDILSAAKLLFAKYSIEGTEKSLQSTNLQTLGDRTRKRCEIDIKGFDKAYYGVEIKQPAAPPSTTSQVTPEAFPSLGFLGPLGVLIDTILNIVSPIVVEAATIVDEAKREKAIQDFLSNPKNQENLKDVGQKLGKAASDYTWAKRLKLAGSVVEEVTTIRKTEIDLGKLDTCKDPNHEKFSRSDSGAPSAVFMMCWRAVWAQLESSVAEILKTADDYDQLADAGDTDTALHAFENVTADLNAVSTNAITNPELFWSYVTQLLTFANTVQTAFSQDNRDKMQKAIDALVKSR